MSVQLISWAYEQRVGSWTEKAVLIALANRANHDTGKCTPSLKRVAEETELSYATVKRAATSLVNKGFITRERQRRTDGSYGSYSYRLESEPEIRESQPGVSVSPGPGVSVSPQEPEVDLEPEVKEEKPNGFSKKVDRIYNHWRQQRKKTRSTYDKISPTRRQKIQARLEEFSEDELLAVIDAIAKDPWPDRRLHDDLTVVFRSREQVERFLEMSNGRASTSPKERAEAWLQNVGWQYEDEAIWEDLDQFGLSEDDKREMAQRAQLIQQEKNALQRS
jgi:DNA-binding MarR family transcriptional regulator